MSNCMNCNKEIESKGTKPSKYCSDKCRKVYVRANGQTKLEQTDKIEAKTEQTDSTNGQADKTIEQTDKSGQIESNPDKSGQVKSEQIKSEQLAQANPNIDKLPLNFGLDNCTCKHCKQIKAINPKAKLNHFGYMNAEQLKLNGFTFNRVSLPSDFDYQRSYV